MKYVVFPEKNNAYSYCVCGGHCDLRSCGCNCPSHCCERR